MSFRNFIDYNTTKQERIKNKIRHPKTSKPKIKVSGQNVSSKTKKSKRNS